MAGKPQIDVTTNRRHLEGLASQGMAIGIIVFVVGLALAGILMAVTGGHQGGHGHGDAEHHGEHSTDDHGHAGDADHSDDGHGGHDGDHADHGAGAHGGDHGDGHHGGHHGYIHEYHWMHSYLMNFCFFVSICIGALFLVLLHHCAKAGWSTVIRRLAEGVSANVLLMAVLAIPLFLYGDKVWLWFDPTVGEHDELIAHKQGYLNKPFFGVRIAVVFGIWIACAFLFRHFSIRQDVDGDVKHTHRLQRIAPLGMLLFALSVTVFAFDFLMSLDAHWFSTIFGVLYFGGSFMAFMAFLAILCVTLQKRGILTTAITDHHYHDIGKLTFAFVVFWTYCAFSQYMLIWYGNIPEETGWYLLRQGGEQSLYPILSDPTGWITFSLLYFCGHFFVPFFFLLSRHIKRNKIALSIGAGWVLFVHWVDMYYLVMPHVRGDSAITDMVLMDIAFFLIFAGLFVTGVVFWLRQASLIAEKDPRLPESLAFENV